tara:strand:+ start:2668 stop:3645 length:978 start_codon:yes stop_codon:yes gene_type:complete
MNKKNSQQLKTLGFTLVEMLMVAAIVATFMVIGQRYMSQRAEYGAIDRASAQMQQILNAGLSYYVNNDKWPADIAALQTEGYLSDKIVPTSPWGTPYTLTPAPLPPEPHKVLTVNLALPESMPESKAKGVGLIIAGRLPFGVSEAAADGSGDYESTGVSASVNIPGQNLNNAGAVNYAGVYNHGGCVPAPVCPVDQEGTELKPEVMLSMQAASGLNVPGSPEIYPITGMTMYLAQEDPVEGGSVPGCNPGEASYGGGADCTATTDPVGTKYWRVCLQLVTSKGIVQWDDTDATLKTFNYAAITAMTRCKTPDEPRGTPFFGPPSP